MEAMRHLLNQKLIGNLAVIAAFFSLFFAYHSENIPDFKLQAKSLSNELTLLKQVFKIVESYYVDKKKIDPESLCKSSVLHISDKFKYLSHQTTTPLAFQLNISKIDESLKVNCNLTNDGIKLAHQLDIMTQFLLKYKKNLLEDHHTNLLQEVIQGALNSLDPHTTFLSAKEYSNLKGQTKGKFGGLGIIVTLEEGILSVVSPIEGTPAEKSGVKKGDKIVKINGDNTYGIELDDLVEKMRGDPGTEIEVAILRKGFLMPKPFTLKREIIKIQNVTSKYLQDGIGKVAISSFGGPIHNDIREKIAEFETKHGKLKGLILDLRNNPGGLLDEAIQASDIFIDSGIIVSTKSAKSSESFARNADTLKTTPIIVLVNGGSASASEIVAGALQDHERAIVIGTKTFGKGSVQSLFDLEENNALKITVSKYYTPSGKSIQNFGITPDILMDPVIFHQEKKKAYFTYSDVGRKEADLSHHLENSERSLRTSKWEMPVAITKEDYEKSVKENPESQDYELELAMSLLKNLNWNQEEDFNALKMMSLMDKHLKSYQSDNQKKLSLKLKEFGIDWNGGKQRIIYPGDLTAKINIKSKEKILKAGEEIQIELTLHNHTEIPLYQVRAQTFSSKDIFENREFVFGNIPPKSQLTKSATMKIPEYWKQEDGFFEILAYSQKEEIFKGGKTPFSIKPIPHPELKESFTFQDLINKKKPQSNGNGDGVINPGETFTIKVMVENKGKNKSSKLTVKLHNLNGEYTKINKEEQSLQGLAIGQKREVTFTIKVNKKFNQPDLSFGLAIIDKAFAKRVIKNIVIPINKNSQLNRASVEVK